MPDVSVTLSDLLNIISGGSSNGAKVPHEFFNLCISHGGCIARLSGKRNGTGSRLTNEISVFLDGTMHSVRSARRHAVVIPQPCWIVCATDLAVRPEKAFAVGACSEQIRTLDSPSLYGNLLTRVS